LDIKTNRPSGDPERDRPDHPANLSLPEQFMSLVSRFFCGFLVLLAFEAVMAQPAPVPGVTRSQLFEFIQGDEIVDSGIMQVTGGGYDRREEFELVRHADGATTLSAIITGANALYQVQARWRFSPSEHALEAFGIGAYEQQAVTVSIKRADNVATLLTDGAMQTQHQASCGDTCLIDMAPSALPMFWMARRYDEAQGGPQEFQWVARSLTVDRVLLEGSAEIRKLGDHVFAHDEGPVPVRQYFFVEDLKDEVSGQFFQVDFNLYIDDDGRPLAFAARSTTAGERVGFEGITEAIPPRFPE
jgi:hypothetical protein